MAQTLSKIMKWFANRKNRVMLGTILMAVGIIGMVVWFCTLTPMLLTDWYLTKMLFMGLIIAVIMQFGAYLVR